jgi:hypothetical protein
MLAHCQHQQSTEAAMLHENAIRAAMRRNPDKGEPWLVEAFDTSGNVVQTWTRVNKPDGLVANIERQIARRKIDQ